TVWVASDAIASDEPLHAVTTRRYLEARGVKFLSSAEIIMGLDDGVTRKLDLSGPVAAAVNAFRSYEPPNRARADLVCGLIEVLTPEVEYLAALMANEIGKPIRFGRTEGQQSVAMLQNILSRAERQDLSTEEHDDYVIRRRPHGAIAVITPW